MKAVILAAGEGLRLRPFTEDKPKVMLPVANKPILHHVIDSIKKTSINEIIVIIGYQKNKILQYFDKIPDLKLDFIEQKNQLGTAHALLTAESKVDDDFIVVFGDNLIGSNSLQQLIDSKNQNGLLITHHVHPSKYGVVGIKGKNVETISEKPEDKTSQYIATGVYKFQKSIFNSITTCVDHGDLGLTAVIQQLISEGNSIGTVKTTEWSDVVYPWDLLSVNEHYLNNVNKDISGTIEKNVQIKGPVIISKDSKILSGSYLVGPLIIGEGCEIGPNACIFPSTVIGNNCVIEPFSCIRNSIIMEECRIGSHVSIANSILDDGVRMQNHVSILEDQAFVRLGDEIKQVRNIGGMIGGNAVIGNNSVIDPGIIIGKNASIAPLKYISKNILNESYVM